MKPVNQPTAVKIFPSDSWEEICDTLESMELYVVDEIEPQFGYYPTTDFDDVAYVVFPTGEYRNRWNDTYELLSEEDFKSRYLVINNSKWRGEVDK